MKAVLFLVSLVLLCSCCTEEKEADNAVYDMKITSPAFADAGRMPDKYTCSGSDISPPLSFVGIPKEAKTLALIMDDPDAPRGTYDHWLVWNIQIVSGIPEDSVPEKAVEGTNTGGELGYHGPCPPPGKPHRYFFKLYALDSALDLPEGATKSDLETAMKGRILAQAQTYGTYSR